VLTIEPDNAKAYNNLGVIAYAQGDCEGALQAFKKALQCDNTMEYCLFNIRMIEDEQKE
jgi:lipoprotein NlpI